MPGGGVAGRESGGFDESTGISEEAV